MNSVLISIVFNTVRMLVGSGLFDRTALLVRELITSPLSGEAKKQEVKDFLKRERASLSKILVDGLIFAVRLKHEK